MNSTLVFIFGLFCGGIVGLLAAVLTLSSGVRSRDEEIANLKYEIRRRNSDA